jgi:excinuclease ABC subunit B
MYAEKETDSMKRAVRETDRRREIQRKYNQTHGITPASIRKSIQSFDYTMTETLSPEELSVNETIRDYQAEELNLDDMILDLEYKMKIAAENLEFEMAAQYRDKIRQLKDLPVF